MASEQKTSRQSYGERRTIVAETTSGERAHGHVPPSAVRRRALLDVLVDQLGHLEHRDFALAAENGLELVVGVDHAALLRILKPVALDVGPELLRDLGARDRIASDNRGEHWSGLLRRHERRVRRPLLLRLLGGWPFRSLFL